MNKDIDTTPVAEVTEVKTPKQNSPVWIIIVLALIAIVASFFVGRQTASIDLISPADKEVTDNVDSTTNTPEDKTPAIVDKNLNKDLKITIVLDKNCWEECEKLWVTEDSITKYFKSAPFLTNASIKVLDASDAEGKKVLKDNEIKLVPAVLFSSNTFDDKVEGKSTELAKSMVATKWGLFEFPSKGFYNVETKIFAAEVSCDNKKDDDKNGKIDCKDEACAQNELCIPKAEVKKSDRPVADLYIMSYCPYGLQAQKGYLEVMSKLGKVADVNVKWVQYIMHGQKEADENVLQECIQKEQKDKYVPYLNCFLKEEGKGESCLKEAKIDTKKLDTCIKTTKTEFKVDEKMADTSKQYPDFDINREAALKAGVQWSPTFVLNWVKLDKVWRDAKSYAKEICDAFTKKPKECEQEFQSVNFDPMFGFTTGNWQAANAGCGQ